MFFSDKKVNNCHLNKMQLYAFSYFAILMLFTESDCRLHRRSHQLRRQNEQVFQNPNQMMPYFHPMQPQSPQFPPGYPNLLPPNSGYPVLSYPAAMPPMFSNIPGPAVVYPGVNSNPVFNLSPVVTSTPLLPSPQYQSSNFQNSSQYQNQSPINSRRRRKNVPPDDKNAVEKLLEKGKKILGAHPMGLGKENPSDSLEDGYEEDKNATIIPIPKGVQVKTFSDHDENHVEKVVNISSTQRTLSVDNNTEIENVVEMQMEKKVEDEKGDNKGSEEVRIVETELVKPLMKLKLSNITKGNRHRRFHPWKFSAHRRSKRSEKESEVPKPSSIYNKIAKRFLTDLKIKGSMDERNEFLNQQEASNTRDSEFKIMKNKVKAVAPKQVRDDSLYDNDELGDFLKHFLDQLKKFKRIRENIENKAQHMEFSNSSDNWFNFKRTKSAKKNRHHEYPEHMKIVMNFNMTLDTKTKEHSIRYRNVPQKSRNDELSLDTTIKPEESTTQQMTLKVLFINDGNEKESKFLSVILLLSIVIFVLPTFVWIFPKIYRTIRLDSRSPTARTYGFYQEKGNEKTKELRHYRRENVCGGDYLQLEWQSENGDWLSDKEMEFK